MRAGLRLPSKGRVSYVKPLQTGAFDQDDPVADSSNIVRLVGDGNLDLKRLDRTTLWCWAEAVSPHLAAERAASGESGSVAKWRRPPPSDQEVRDRIMETMTSVAKHPDGVALTVMETAGGVLSPGASRTFQADIYKSLGFGAILVGDPRLGGISITLAALEALASRGYDITAIVLIGDTKALGNADYLKYWIDQGNLSRMKKEYLLKTGQDAKNYVYAPPKILLPPKLPPKPKPLGAWLKEVDPIYDAFVADYIKNQ